MKERPHSIGMPYMDEPLNVLHLIHAAKALRRGRYWNSHVTAGMAFGDIRRLCVPRRRSNPYSNWQFKDMITCISEECYNTC